MRSLKLVLLFTLLAFAARAQRAYTVSSIPEELRKDVNVVVREDHIVFRILAKNKATLNVKLAATIFNRNGRSYAQPTVHYDKLSKITSFKGNVYDANGNLVRKLKSSEISDRSAYDGMSLFSDNRYKEADLGHGTYPFTVEYEYEIEYRFLYAIQGSSLVPGEKVSVENFSYQLIFPSALSPRYKLVNLDAPPTYEKRPDGSESYTWSFQHISPIKLEPHGPFFQEQVPRILAAPGLFEYEGYAGDMSTWESYGAWEAQLNEGRDVLPAATVQKAVDMTNDLTSTEDKVKVLYEYLQNKTRYVNISLGIGGLQPFEASVVDKVGYGDCKALSNYMVALLKAAGITGYYSTIRAGDFRDNLMLDFPSHQGNHVIVAVPNGADTLWLECTSQTAPFGYTGRFTGDRKAFLLTEHGAVWANTPRYTHNDNLQIRHAEVYVDAAGDAKANIKTRYAGLQYENDHLDFVLNHSSEEQKKWIQKTTSIPSFDVESFSMTNVKDRMPSAFVQLDLILRRYAATSGKRIFVIPNLMNRSTFIPEAVENRKTSVYQRMGYTDIDSIYYHMPEGVYPEFLSEPVSLRSRFGEYHASFQVIQGDVLYIRKMVMYKGQYPPESYNELIDFHKSVIKADNLKLVFLTKT